MPVDERVCLDGKKKAELVKQLHERVRQQIERKNKQYASKANKGRRRVIFEPGDWVWVHMRKERFPAHRKSKLSPRGDGPFQVLERINENAYKIDLPGEYNVSSTFNVADISLFDAGSDSRTNPFEEGGDDAAQAHQIASSDPLCIPKRPMTRAHTKQLKEALNGLVDAHQPKEAQGNKKLGPNVVEPLSDVLGLIQVALEDFRAQEMLLEKAGRDSSGFGLLKMFLVSTSMEEAF